MSNYINLGNTVHYTNCIFIFEEFSGVKCNPFWLTLLDLHFIQEKHFRI